MTARLVEDGGELGGAGGNGEDEEGLILLCGGGDGAAWQPLVAAVGGKRAAGVVAVVGVELELELEEEQRGANRTQALQQEFWRLLLNVEAAPSGGSAWQRFEAQHGPLRVLDAAVASAPRGEAAAQQPAPFDPIGAPSTAYFQLLLQELDISAIGNAAARARFELDFMHIIRVNAASANLDIRILDIAPGSVAVSAGVMFLDGAPQAYWQARDFARRLGKYPEKTHFFGCRDFVASYGRSRVTFVKLLHVPSKYTAGTRTGNSSSHVNAIPAWLIMLMCLAVALTGLLLSVHYILDWRKLRAPDLLHYEPLLRPQLRQPSRGVPASR